MLQLWTIILMGSYVFSGIKSMFNFKVNKIKSLFFDYICYALFSSVSGLYLILPLFFHDVFHYSYVRATLLVSVYLVGRAVGVLSYVRLVGYLIKNVQIKQVSMPRLLLVVSSVLTIISLLFIRGDIPYLILMINLCIFGVLTSVFPTLNVAILNGNTHKKNPIKHSSLQRWFQNIGMIGTYALFWFNGKDSSTIFYELALIMCIAALLECAMLMKPFGYQVKNTAVPGANRPQKISLKPFYLLVFLSLVIFMQIPNVYAYYLHDVYHIGASYFSALLVLNCLIVVTAQIPLSKYILTNIKKNASACIGMCFIAMGTFLPIIHSIFSVYFSFVAWTLGEIFLFTTIKAYLMLYSNEDASHNLSIATKYYTLYYLSNLVCPIIIKYVYGSVSAAMTLVVLSVLSVVIGGIWYRKELVC
jgi:hypothetical protein